MLCKNNCSVSSFRYEKNPEVFVISWWIISSWTKTFHTLKQSTLQAMMSVQNALITLSEMKIIKI